MDASAPARSRRGAIASRSSAVDETRPAFDIRQSAGDLLSEALRFGRAGVRIGLYERQ